MPLPIIDIEQMRRWEAATWSSGVTEAEVIRNVGEVVARRTLQLTAPGKSVLVLAGKGHNGDDARALVPQLGNRKVTLMNVLDPALAAAELKVAGERFSLIVDGLFGIGLNRPLDAGWQELIHTINDLGSPILSIDVPSGLNAFTGAPEGTAIRATTTITVGAPKKTMISMDAAEYVGRLEVADNVGLLPPSPASDLQWVLKRDFTQFPPQRPVTGHKGSFGHVVLFAGSLGYHGAAILAARGALRAQPGLVTLFTEERVYFPVASQLQQPMVHPWTRSSQLPSTCSAIAFGPGLAAPDFSAAFWEQLQSLWRNSEVPVIADASALDWLPPGENAHQLLRIITPHPGEAARLLGVSVCQVQKDRVTALRQLSAKYGNCLVMLKGHHTLTGRSAGPVYVNSSGNPHLAQGGSGDVLLGYLAGLIAQPALQADPDQAAAFAAWQHGAAADELAGSRKNWTISDLLERLGEV